MIIFLCQEIEVSKNYVYLKNERTGSSTTRKLKMIGTCVEIGNYPIFKRLWCENDYYINDSYIHTKDKVYILEDVICEYIPTEEQRLKVLAKG